MFSFRRPNSASLFSCAALAGVLILTGGCGKDGSSKVAAVQLNLPPVVDVNLFEPVRIGKAANGIPWIANLTTVDLDKDGRRDVLFCDGKENKVVWLRQLADGTFEEIVIAENMKGPVHVEPCDIDGDGDLDLLIASMGEIFPNNDKIGTLFILENDGKQHFTPHIVLENVARITDVQPGDFNGDGKIDLAVGQFGYDQGEVRWMERTGPWEFKSHILLNLSGAINVCVADFNGDGKPDIAALMSQEWEEVFLFTNEGNGRFSSKVIFGSTNEDYATSNMSLCDLNKDGKPDLLFSNGDGFGPSPVPGPRPWHGVQWLENIGGGKFKFHRVGDLGGAYSPIAVDLDGDGFMDVVAVSGLNNWDQPNPVAMMWFKNDGKCNFQPHILAYEPIQLLTVEAADMDGSGKPSLVTGAFFSTLPHNRISRILLWKRPAGK